MLVVLFIGWLLDEITKRSTIPGATNQGANGNFAQMAAAYSKNYTFIIKRAVADMLTGREQQELMMRNSIKMEKIAASNVHVKIHSTLLSIGRYTGC